MTTPVGSIRVDLTIDGSKAAAQLTGDLRKLADTKLPVSVDTKAAHDKLGKLRADAARDPGKLRVDADTSRAQQAIADVRRRLTDIERTRITPDVDTSKIGGKASAAGRDFGALFMAGAKAGLGALSVASIGSTIADQFRQAMSVGMDWTRNMNTLGAVTGATGEQMKAVAATARQLGTDITLPATSANDAAAAMTELAKGGFTVEQSMAAARGTLQLAAAAQIDAAQAATIQSAALQAFGLSADSAGKMSDTLANAANASSAEITDVAAALQQAGTVANQFGLTAEDTAAAIALLANNGIKGSDAGTLLKTSLQSLTDQGNPAQGAIEQLGLTVYDAQGKFVKFSDLLGQLGDAAKRLTPEQYQAATATLFGSDAMRIAGVAAKDGSVSYDRMRQAIERQGAAAEVAAAKTQGLPGAVERVKNAWESLQLKGYDAIQGPISKVLDLTSAGLDKLGSVGSSPGVKALGDALAAAAPGATAVVSALAKAGGAIGGAAWTAFSATLSAIAGALKIVAPLLNTVGSLVSANQGAVTAFVAAWAGLRFLPGVLGAVSGAFLPVTNAVRGVVPRLAEMRGGVTNAAESWQLMTRWMQQANPELSRSEARMALLKNGASGLASGGLGLVKGAASGLVDVLGGPLNIALMAGVAAFGAIASKNAEATAAAQGYAAATKASADAQISLNDALLKSSGLMDEQAKAAAGQRITAAVGELDARSKSSASFLDQFRDASGSLWGGLTGQVGVGGGAIGTLAARKDETARIASEAKAAIDGLRLSQEALRDQVAGGQPAFDALTAALEKQGAGGAVAAEQLRQARTEILGAQDAGATAAPVLARLGDDVAGSAAKIRTAFAAMPTNVPISVSAPGGQEVYDLLDRLGVKVATDNDKRIRVDAPMAPEVLQMLEKLGIKVTTDNEKRIIVTQTGAEEVGRQLDAMSEDRTVVIRVLADTAAAGIDAGALLGAGIPGRAFGGAIGGNGGPRADDQLIWASTGEHMWAADEVAAAGGHGAMYRMRAAVKSGLLRYAGGGAIGGSPLSPPSLDGGTDPAARQSIDLLTAIRDGLGNGLAAVRDAVNGLSARLSTLNLGGMAGGVSLAGLRPITGSVDGEHPQITALLALAQQKFGLGTKGPGIDFAGNEHHPKDGKLHPAGQAGDFSGGTPQQMAALANFMTANFAPYIAELIHQGPGVTQNVLGGKAVPAIDMPGSPYSTGQAGYHGDHVHIAIKDDMAAAFQQALSGAGATLAGPGGVAVVAAAPGGLPAAATAGMTQDQVIDAQLAALDAQDRAEQRARQNRESQQKIADLQQTIEANRQKMIEANADPKKSAADRQDAERRYNKSLQDLSDAQDDQASMLRRQQVEDQRQQLQDAKTAASGGSGSRFSPDDLPFGDPRKIMAGILGGIGMDSSAVASIVGGVFGNAVTQATSVQLPGPLGYPATPTAPTTDVASLVQQGNPLAVAAAAGLNVPDYTRAGGGPSAAAANIAETGLPVADVAGRIYSDTAALIDRTFTSLDTADKARHDQVMSALNQIAAKLGKDVLAPTVQGATEAAINSTAQQTSGLIGNAVAAALPIAGMAGGGPVSGGIPGRDSVPILGMPGEHMLTVADVNALGGHGGVTAFRAALHRSGGLRLMASGGPVSGNATVGADLLGVGQIPVLGAVVNALMQVLLQLIGVQIEARDTLLSVATDAREFRGDFKAFDAAGRVMSDTAGLADRTSTSEREAADERLRIAKLVMDGLVKYAIETVIVPIAKAVGNALLQVGSGALQGGLGAAFPGGSIVGSVIGSALTTGGSAGIDIASQILSSLAENAISVGLTGLTQLLPSLAPNLTGAIFGGRLAALVGDPITALFSTLLGGVATVLTGALGGASFDDGGIAHGVGLLPKATVRPERVLSPDQTATFDRFVAWLEGGGLAGAGAGRRVEIHAPFTVTGGEQAGRQVHDRLLAMI